AVVLIGSLLALEVWWTQCRRLGSCPRGKKSFHLLGGRTGAGFGRIAVWRRARSVCHLRSPKLADVVDNVVETKCVDLASRRAAPVLRWLDAHLDIWKRHACGIYLAASVPHIHHTAEEHDQQRRHNDLDETDGKYCVGLETCPSHSFKPSEFPAN
ncbi:unnamed protein product, partial [Ectocarpus sp. 8 AP-2014]